jgi:thymidine phosphorylase
VATYDVVDLIKTKRDGDRLGDAEIDWLIAAYTAGEVAEQQMSALAMAVLLRGLDRPELRRR